MSPTIFLLLFTCTLATSLISGVAGMSGGIVLLSLMTVALPLSVVIPLHGAIQLFSNAVRSWLLRQHLRYDFLLPYLLGLPLGLFLSLLFIQRLNYPELLLFMVATLIMYTLFRPKKLPSWKIAPRWFFIHGIAAGLLALMVGAVGPFLAPFFIRDDLSKEEVVATKAGMQTMTHLLKIPSFLYLGFPYQDYLPQMLCLMVAAGLGTHYGVRLLKKINQNLFNRLFRAMLFLAGLWIYYKIFFAP